MYQIPSDYMIDFPICPITRTFIPKMPMYDMVSMGPGSLYPIPVDEALFLTCYHLSHSVGLFSVVCWNRLIYTGVCICAKSEFLSGCF